jgi:predicted ABC-class ATPase
MTDSPVKEHALRDGLARRFHGQCSMICAGRRGTGNSGLITIAEPGQAILERSSVVVTGESVEARFFLGLPASGRDIQSAIAETMLFEELPRIVHTSLLAENLDLDTLSGHLRTAEEAELLRARLEPLGLVAFIADGAILPRASGVDETALTTESVVPFRSPESLRVTIDLPSTGPITGMGIPKGVTLIVGGGYHGKSTLLRALELGIYNYVPGDGRERSVSLPETVKIRASSGRNVVATDISAFINGIPRRPSTASFTTANASGSTSQAAFISEAIEARAKVLLMDEDTCAANFMIRDRLMQQLVARRDEPITAFVDRVRELYEEHAVSTVLVMGGSGDYFSVADRVIQMIEFTPYDVTDRARAVVAGSPIHRQREGAGAFLSPAQRIPVADNLDPANEYGHFRITSSHPQRLSFGRTEVDLADVEQLVEAAQTKAVGQAIHYAKRYMDAKTPLRDVIHRVMDDIERRGLDILDPQLTGDLARFRGLELAAALNRMRVFGATQKKQQNESY